MIALREPDGSVLCIAPDVTAAILIRACQIECGHDCWIDMYAQGEAHEILGEASTRKRDLTIRRRGEQAAA